MAGWPDSCLAIHTLSLSVFPYHLTAGWYETKLGLHRIAFCPAACQKGLQIHTILILYFYFVVLSE